MALYKYIKYGIHILSSNNNSILKIKRRIFMTTNELKDYLYHVYLLEKQKYTIETSYASLQNQIKQCQNIISQEKNVKLADDSATISIGEYLGGHIILLLVGGYFIGGVGFFIDTLTNSSGGLDGLIEKVLSIMFIVLWPIGELVSCSSLGEWINSWNGRFLILFFIILTVFVAWSYFSDKKNIIQDNKDNAKYNESLIFNSKQTIQAKENYINFSLLPECNYLKNMYERTTSLLHNLYSLGIIGEKYQNLVAISSFYEYFEYGRCDSLSGPYGAYNKYEDELYKKIIIGKLDDIISKLDEIRNNQIMLYHVIEDSRTQTTKLLSDLQTQNYINHQDTMTTLSRLDYNTACIKTNQDLNFYWKTINQKYN